ncbi:MAG: hypothetical protein ACW98K_12415 [Candidatus Kariarchaeaceae archaeon]|jgi:hypothetical protein
MKIKITVLMISIGIFLFLLPIGLTSAEGSGIHLNIRSSGELESLNATGVEDSKSLDVKSSLVQIGDGSVSTVWDDAKFTPVSSFGIKGAVASFFGQNDVYFLIKHDADLKWVALQWDTELSVDPGADMEGMHPNDDMWIFGETSDISVLGDAVSAGPEGTLAYQDISDDLYWERVQVNDSEGQTDYIAWEIRRSKNTGDTVGRDVVFTPDESIHVMLASDVHHKQNDPTVLYFKLSSKNLGTGNNVIVTVPLEKKIDANGEFMKHTSIGLLLGMLSYMFVFFPTMAIVKKLKEAEE